MTKPYERGIVPTVEETCPKCNGPIPENRRLTTPDPDPYRPSSVLHFVHCSVCEHLFLNPISHTFSEIYRFELELPRPLTGQALELLEQIQKKVRNPAGGVEYEVNYLSELQLDEMTEEDVLDQLVDGSTLSLSIKEFRVSWQCSPEELEAMGITDETPMSELVDQVTVEPST